MKTFKYKVYYLTKENEIVVRALEDLNELCHYDNIVMVTNFSGSKGVKI